VHWVASAERALEFVPGEWDLIVADVRLPGMNGIDFARAVRTLDPLVAVVILTADTALATAVEAIRANADDYVTKPIDQAAFERRIVELVALSERRRREHRRVVLAIGAHPDDVEIGCGGTLLAHVARGDTVAVLTLTDGRAREARRAAELMGVRLFHAAVADTSVADAIDVIKAVIDEVHPQIVYTHTLHDVHHDHRNVHRATLAAARAVPCVYSYQAPSTTVDFRPMRFEPIDDFLAGKLAAVRAYRSHVAVRGCLEEDLLIATARYWSRFAQARHAEPFEVVRETQPDQGARARGEQELSRAA
jgi:LmbE family N-acetylglucosaminyl deacetylase